MLPIPRGQYYPKISYLLYLISKTVTQNSKTSSHEGREISWLRPRRRANSICLWGVSSLYHFTSQYAASQSAIQQNYKTNLRTLGKHRGIYLWGIAQWLPPREETAELNDPCVLRRRRPLRGSGRLDLGHRGRGGSPIFWKRKKNRNFSFTTYVCACN